MNLRVTNLSSKGQVVIPNDLRKRLKLTSGTNFLVFTDGSNILLKPIETPKKDSFDELIKASSKIAAKRNLKRKDVNKIIKLLRSKHRT